MITRETRENGDSGDRFFIFASRRDRGPVVVR
jgi:hypothetical protein